ncbi:MAG: alpha/beta hydrolase domain-containing protein [Acidimicrobiia bacterium]
MTRTHVPTVSAPVEGGKGWIFGCPAEDLRARGFIMEEYFLDGTAVSYSPTGSTGVAIDGRWDVEAAEEASYRTRAYVVRPADPARFNGVVLVNWQNVTIGVDFGMPDTEQLERGYAWVGVTTQRVAHDGQPSLTDQMPATVGLRQWDPERYGSLHHPGDAFSYDIFSQVARRLREGPSEGVDMLGGLAPRLLIATGGSQSAMRLGSYINIAHQKDRVFDGFLLTVHWGLCPPPPDMSLVESFDLTPEFRFQGSAQIRDDGDVPILVVNSESETMMVSIVRQPDSDTFRFWEMAGTAHAGGESAGLMTTALIRDGVSDGLPVVDEHNTIAWDYIARAGLERLVEWIDTKHPPVSIPPITLDPEGGIAHDDIGNALGGVRMPDVVAPLAVHAGMQSDLSVSALGGVSTPLSAERIRELYPDAATFQKAWDGAVDDLAELGLVLPDAVAAVKARGRAAYEAVPGLDE